MVRKVYMGRTKTIGTGQFTFLRANGLIAPRTLVSGVEEVWLFVLAPAFE